MITISPEVVGKPFTWRTALYGDVAVHVAGISPNGKVANLTIDGGAAATPANRFPELSDGIGFAVEGQLIRRVRTSTKRNRGKTVVLTQTSAETPGTVAYSQGRTSAAIINRVLADTVTF